MNQRSIALGEEFDRLVESNRERERRFAELNEASRIFGIKLVEFARDIDRAKHLFFVPMTVPRSRMFVH